jgi:hypothetical protein
MPRATMAALISRVRGLIGDPAGADQTFSDDDVQTALDRHQTVVWYATLRPEPTILPSSIVETREYVAGVGDWEADEVLYNAAWQPLTPATADRLTGRWTFASPGQPPPVTILGKTYDIYGASVDLLEAWAGQVARAFDFSSDGQEFRRSQQTRALLELAREYRRRLRPSVAVQARIDVNEWW